MTAVRQRTDHRSDARLIVDANDDPAAFAALYDRHVAAVHQWLDRRIGWLASDLTAETFARAWLIRRRFRDDRDGSALPWLLGSPETLSPTLPAMTGSRRAPASGSVCRSRSRPTMAMTR
jgi:hypothetical protein